MEIKDSVANLTTITATASAMADWNSVFTMGLIITGIILNIVRIRAHTKKNKD